MRPITRAGQHQAPISAGMLTIMVIMLRRSDLRSSDRCSAGLGSRSPSIGSLSVPPTSAVEGWLSRGGRRVQTSPTQSMSISDGGGIIRLGKVSWKSRAERGGRPLQPKLRARRVGAAVFETTLLRVPSHHGHHSPGRLGARRPPHLLPSAALGGSRCCTARAGAACSPAHPCYYGRQSVGCRKGGQGRSAPY